MKMRSDYDLTDHSYPALKMKCHWVGNIRVIF